MPRPFSTALATTLLVLLIGCGAEAPAPWRDEVLSQRDPAAIVSAAKHAPFRLVRDLRAFESGIQRELLRVPVTENYQVYYGGGGRVANGALVMTAEDKPGLLQVPVDVFAEDYNQLRVTMKVDRGSRCLLKWRSEVEPSFQSNSGITMPTFPGDTLNSYVFRLDVAAPDTWVAQIEAIEFWPSVDEPANAEIVSLEFARYPTEGPRRVTLENTTCEALFGSPPPWEIVVPPEAAFEVRLGMLPRAWQALSTDGARFVVTLESLSSEIATLVDQTLTPQEDPAHREWVLAQADLAPFEGERVRISMDVDPLGASQGDLAFWGDPVVFSRNEDKDATPVVLIVCDTLRADHVGCYGYAKNTTPLLDAWCDEAVLFENALVPETWTLPSHITMFTGLYPKNHGVTSNSNLAEGFDTLPELLSGAGYLTAGFTGVDWWLWPWRGFSQGFDLYDHAKPTFRPIFDTLPLVETWLNRHPTPRWFLFFHNYDIHSKTYALDYDLPYGPDDPDFLHYAKSFTDPPRFEREGVETRATHFLMAANRGELDVTDLERDYMVALYDDSVRMVDHYLAEFFEDLKRRGTYDPALIIVTSDHGESFGERDKYLHEQTYAECSHVPLLIKFPEGRFAGRRVTELVQLADLMPTILDVLDVPYDGPCDGQSLLDLLEGTSTGHDEVFIQRLVMQAVRTDEWSLHHDTAVDRHELFHVAEDPGERVDVVEEQPKPRDRLGAELAAFFVDDDAGWHFAFAAGDEPWEPELAFYAGGRFESSKFLHTHREEITVLQDGRTVRGTLKLAPSDTEELVFRTVSPRSRIAVSVRSGADFTLLEGGDNAAALRAYDRLLDPADAAFGDHASPEATVDPPALVVWYVPAKERGEEAPAPSEEMQELIDSLGYGETSASERAHGEGDVQPSDSE